VVRWLGVEIRILGRSSALGVGYTVAMWPELVMLGGGVLPTVVDMLG